MNCSQLIFNKTSLEKIIVKQF